MTDHALKVDSRDPQAWLVLLHAQGIGPARGLRLLRHAGSAEAAIGLSRKDLARLDIDEDSAHSLRHPSSDNIERDLRWLQAANRHLVTFGSQLYPSLLSQIPDPPLMLFVAGDPELLSHPQIAMVGSRNPTVQGRENAAAFAHFLSRAGFAITSGLARGIDAASHEGALKAGGFTIAVCGTGLDEVYPKENRDLAGKIARSGAVVSEFPTGTVAHPSNFPRRNRIISGLSVGTLVVEAAHRSGSLITARLASEQGREIFAIPGSIHNPMARGCHRLIRDGARLVESGGDVIEELGNLTRSALTHAADPGNTQAQSKPELDADYDKLLHSCGHEPSTIDQLCERTGLTADAVSSMLLILELQGYVKTANGGRYLSSI